MKHIKRGRTDSISSPAKESPGRQTTSLKIWSKRKTRQVTNKKVYVVSVKPVCHRTIIKIQVLPLISVTKAWCL